MGTASGAFTALFGIDFPKAIYKGNVLGLSVRAPKSVYDGGLQGDSADKKLAPRNVPPFALKNDGKSGPKIT